MTTRTHSLATKADIYTRITETILAQLEQGTRPWAKPWNAEHLAGRITRPLRAGGQPYRGINVVMLWLAATLKGDAWEFLQPCTLGRLAASLRHEGELAVER